MLVIQCDRCKEIVARITVIKIAAAKDTDIPASYDLCGRCLDYITNVIKAAPPRMARPERGGL